MNISSETSYTYESNSNSIDRETFQLTMNIMYDLLGFPINFYVIWLIVTGTGNGLAAEFFNLNLSICDIFFCLRIFLQMTLQNKIPVELYIILDGFAMTGRPLFQSVICVERYLAVVYPVTFLKSKPLRYRLICCAFVWVAGLSFGVSMIIISIFPFTAPYNWYYISVMTQFVVLLSIQLFCLVSVLRALKQSGPGDGRREVQNHMKRRAFYLILITILTMLIINGPYIVTHILLSSGKTDNTLNLISYPCLLFGVLVQPLLFLYRVGKLPFINSQ